MKTRLRWRAPGSSISNGTFKPFPKVPAGQVVHLNWIAIYLDTATSANFYAQIADAYGNWPVGKLGNEPGNPCGALVDVTLFEEDQLVYFIDNANGTGSAMFIADGWIGDVEDLETIVVVPASPKGGTQ